jgi:hypothetical protein
MSGTSAKAEQGAAAPAGPFRHKALAAALAAALGVVGAGRIYLGQRFWWLPALVTALALSGLVGQTRWYERPALFVLVAVAVTGFLQALFVALMPDEKFDARFNRGNPRRNTSGWGAVLVAAATLLVGAGVLMFSLALLFQLLLDGSAR